MVLPVVLGIVEDQGMNDFIPHGQAFQDKFAAEIIGHTGTFLDIGASHPIELSNTYALEQLGWTGVLVECNPEHVALLQSQRASRVIAQDAIRIDWRKELQIPVMDYLSLDVDESSFFALQNILFTGPRFRCMTVEHDAYKHGVERRDAMVNLLESQDYMILCKDVCHEGLSYEVWVVDTSFAMQKLTRDTLDKFTHDGLIEGKDFWK
jgi:hypothetical protein